MSIENIHGEVVVRTAVEMAKSVGENSQTLPREWSGLSNLDFGGWISKLGEQLGFSWGEWSQMLVKAGISMEKTIELQLQKLQNSKVEQETAIQLRKDFGQPQAPLPQILEVFTELAMMEAAARENLQVQANAVEQWWQAFQRKITEILALSLAVELDRLEQEEDDYSKALVSSKQMTAGKNSLHDSLQYVEQSVKERIKEIATKKNELLESLKRLGYGILQNVESRFETTVFQASRQSLVLTVVK
jgi:hypothetical protein